MAVYKRGRVWWYRFTWDGKPIRESTKQTNKRVAEQIEAAHKTSLAKGEVGIRDRVLVPTLKDFAEQDFLPFIEPRFKNKPKTLEYYKNGIKNLTGFATLANSTMDMITNEDCRLRYEATGSRAAGEQHQPPARGLAADAEAGDGMGQGHQGASESGDAPWRKSPRPRFDRRRRGTLSGRHRRRR
jgi:hypothetical protein